MASRKKAAAALLFLISARVEVCKINFEFKNISFFPNSLVFITVNSCQNGRNLKIITFASVLPNLVPQKPA